MEAQPVESSRHNKNILKPIHTSQYWLHALYVYFNIRFKYIRDETFNSMHVQESAFNFTSFAFFLCFFFLFDFWFGTKMDSLHIRQTLTLPTHLFSQFCLHFGRCCCCYSRHSSDIPIHRICKMNECLCVFIQNSLVSIIHWTNNDANDDDDEQKEYAMYACVSRLHKHKTKWI